MKLSCSPEETKEIAKSFAKTVKNGDFICFYGDLGAGKTTFIKSVVETITETTEKEVVSPTFIYLNSYPGKITVHHFDLYRLENEEQFLSLAFDDFLSTQDIVCVEWPERIQNILPENRRSVRFTYGEKPNERKISIT